MIVPSTNLRGARAGRKAVGYGLLLVLVCAAAWWVWVVVQIRDFASHDEAEPADAIAIFGAAEYDGRPSPVLKARLDHGLVLYQRGIAPLLITLGGGDEGDAHSEGGVGHDYLLAHGVPEAQIIAETQSNNTEESAARLAVIARTNRLQRVVVVSDGTHLFRIHALCDRDGLRVFTSPRPTGKTISKEERFERLFHEVASYTAWRLGLH